MDNNGKKGVDRLFVKTKPHALSRISKVYGIISGKGGVGKSTVTSLLAVGLARMGKTVGILDGDILGPSIPKAFGIDEKATGKDDYVIPAQSRTGIQIVSSAMFVEKTKDPILWRGPLVQDFLLQLFKDVYWYETDVLLIDMPPGTGDIALTAFQSLPVDGIIVVTSPQDLVREIVEKAITMADILRIPVVGMVENYAYFVCDECHKKHYIYGQPKSMEEALQYQIPVYVQLPIREDLSLALDHGNIENIYIPELDPLINVLK